MAFSWLQCAPQVRLSNSVSSRCLALALLYVLGGCQSKPSPEAGTQVQVAEPAVFSVLAGSELKELEPALVAAAEHAGVRLRVSYAGTLEAVDRINAGESFDALLPPNGAYPMLSLKQRPLAREKLFYARVALGVKQSKVASLGWDKHEPTWAEIAHAAKKGEFRYGMTNPTSSNTGMSALFAVTAAAAKKTEDLKVEDVNADIIKDFLTGQAITAGSSGWLADVYRKEPAAVDGLVNYESVILRLNDQVAEADRLRLIYPKDGVITADYPLLLLNESTRSNYQKLVSEFKGAEFQRTALPPQYLRPSSIEVEAAQALPKEAVAELSFPADLQVIDQVLSAYLNEWRRPSTSIFVLDVSGSMSGSRIAGLRDALRVLAGSETSGAGRFANFQKRERVVLITFSDDVAEPKTVNFDPAQVDAARAEVQAYVEALRARGGTAIFSALSSAIDVAHAEMEADPTRFVSVVLLSDGESNAGLSYHAFRTNFSELFANPAHPRVFTILFGEANVPQMRELAEWTGGRSFDARTASLPAVFKEIRGYQ